MHRIHSLPDPTTATGWSPTQRPARGTGPRPVQIGNAGPQLVAPAGQAMALPAAVRRDTLYLDLRRTCDAGLTTAVTRAFPTEHARLSAVGSWALRHAPSLQLVGGDATDALGTGARLLQGMPSRTRGAHALISETAAMAYLALLDDIAQGEPDESLALHVGGMQQALAAGRREPRDDALAEALEAAFLQDFRDLHARHGHTLDSAARRYCDALIVQMVTCDDGAAGRLSVFGHWLWQGTTAAAFPAPLHLMLATQCPNDDPYVIGATVIKELALSPQRDAAVVHYVNALGKAWQLTGAAPEATWEALCLLSVPPDAPPGAGLPPR